MSFSPSESPINNKLNSIREFTSCIPLVNLNFEFDFNNFMGSNQKRTVLHFAKTREIIHKFIVLTEKRKEQLKAEKNSLEQQYKHQNETILTEYSSKFWPKYLFLSFKLVKYKFIYVQNSEAIANNIIKKLKELDDYCQALQNFPEEIYFLHNKIKQFVMTDVPDRLKFKISAITAELVDLNAMMSFIPCQFSKFTIKEHISTLLNTAKDYIDPNTRYLKEVNEYQIFLDAVKSRYSPVLDIFTSRKNGLMTTEQQIKVCFNVIQNFTGVTNEDALYVLGIFCMRLFIDESMHIEPFFSKSNPNLFDKFNGTALKDILCSQDESAFHDIELIFHIDHNTQISEFISSNVLLKPVSKMLSDCIFLVNPLDIAYQISIINLRITGFIAASSNADINDPGVQKMAEIVWRAVFIDSRQVGIDSIFDFINHWKYHPYSPKELFNTINLATEALKYISNQSSK